MDLYTITRKFRDQIYSQPPPPSLNTDIEVDITPSDYTHSIYSFDSNFESTLSSPSLSSWVSNFSTPSTISSNSVFHGSGFNKTNPEFEPTIFTPPTSSASSQTSIDYPLVKRRPSIEDLAELFEYLDAREASVLAGKSFGLGQVENVTEIAVRRVERTYGLEDRKGKEKKLGWLPAGTYQSPDGFVVRGVGEDMELHGGAGKTREQMENELGVRL